MTIRKAQLIATASLLLLTLAGAAHAQVDLGMQYAAGTGLTSVDIRSIAAELIRSALGLLGLYLVTRIMWGGFLMMTHGGKDDKKAEAMKLITDSVFGFFVIMISSSAATFVVNAIANATTGAVDGMF